MSTLGVTNTNDYKKKGKASNDGDEKTGKDQFIPKGKKPGYAQTSNTMDYGNKKPSGFSGHKNSGKTGKSEYIPKGKTPYYATGTPNTKDYGNSKGKTFGSESKGQQVRGSMPKVL